MSFVDAVRQTFGGEPEQPDAPEQPFAKPRPYQLGHGVGYAKAALEAEVARLSAASNGTRNHTLNRAAFCLGQLVAGGELAEADVVRQLTETARAVGLDEKEIDPTIRSGLDGGAKSPRTVPARDSPTSRTEPPLAEIGDDFWDARGYLRHIREAAHSRQRSAPAVLGVVLARVAAMISHRLQLPPIVGASAGLSLISVVLAPPGVGKSTANQIGSTLLLSHGDVADQLPIGSGEGFVEVFFGLVDEEDEQGKPQRVRKQVRHNAYWYVDEGQVLGEIGTRRNATLLPTIRSAFTGSTLGQMNASEERRRIVPSGSYTIGMTVAMQTVLAGALLDDADGGTPQRMLWLPAIDPTIPDTPPQWPGRLPWSPPASFDLNQLEADSLSPYRSLHLPVAEPVKVEIRAADLARARGQETAHLLDAHEGLLRLKVAALLGILDGRLEISEDDWVLANVIKQVSDATRGGVENTVAREVARKELEASSRLAQRAAHADAAVAQRRVVDCARRVAQKVWTDPERWTFAELRRSMGRWRDVFAEGVEHAAAEGWVVEVVEPSHTGSDRRLLRRGEVSPR